MDKMRKNVIIMNDFCKLSKDEYARDVKKEISVV